MTQLRRLESIVGNKRFLIEEEVFAENDNYFIWSYLYLYENDESINDFLLDSVDLAKAQAYRSGGVPLDSWKELEPIKFADA